MVVSLYNLTLCSHSEVDWRGGEGKEELLQKRERLIPNQLSRVLVHSDLSFMVKMEIFPRQLWTGSFYSSAHFNAKMYPCQVASTLTAILIF